MTESLYQQDSGIQREWKRYPHYKESGVESLGEIPDGWNVQKLKYVSTVRLSSVNKKTEDGEEPVRLCNYVDVYYNDYITSDLGFMEATASPSEIKDFTLRKGDVLITKDSEDWNDIAVPAYVRSSLPGVLCGYHLAQIRPDKKIMAGEYLFRSFNANGINDQFKVAANGITRYGIGKFWIDSSLFLVPPLSEQTAIAAFLDRETARIDALIEKKERLIALLEEKRAGLISHAVTKGLDPSVPMKDSGVEWIGMVPAHWIISKLKYCVDSSGPGVQMGPFGSMLTTLSSEFTGCKLYGQENIIKNDFNLGSRWISKDLHHSLQKYELVEGDLVLTRKGSIGQCKIVPIIKVPGIADSDTIRIRPNKKIIIPNFLVRILHESCYIQDQIHIAQRGAIISGLNTSIIENITILLPPIEEQISIMDYCDSKVKRNETVIKKIKSSIGMLFEYRSALISAAVTGKIDLRQEAMG